MVSHSSDVALEGTAGSSGLRREVLQAAKRFKSTWAELGRLLVQVRDGALYEEWGYPSFEAYCAHEIHIRRATALKLTRSFSFLTKHEPKTLTDEEAIESAPPFEVVSVLADAEDRGQLSAAEYRSIRDSIWDSPRPTAELKREVTSRFPPPPPEPVADELQLKRLANAAKKLAADLKDCRKVPAAVTARAKALADEVEKLALNS